MSAFWMVVWSPEGMHAELSSVVVGAGVEPTLVGALVAVGAGAGVSIGTIIQAAKSNPISAKMDGHHIPLSIALEWPRS